MTRLYFMQIEPSFNDAVLDDIIASLPAEKRERLYRYRRNSDRKASAYSEALVRSAVSMLSGIGYGALDMQKSQAGKPFFQNCPGYQFNISHTKDAVAAVLSDKQAGVDVERIRDIDLSLAEKVFSENELALFRETEEHRYQRFFEIWTKKEALLKYRGTGLTNNLKSIDVADVFCTEKFVTYVIGGCVISVCTGTPRDEIDFISISEQAFVEMWRKCQR